MAGLDGDGSKYWVEVEQNGKPTRIGPYREPAKAKLRHRMEVAGWNGQGKKPELTIQPAGVVAKVGVTTPTRRMSPRTGKTAKRATLPGVPNYREGDDTRRGA